MIVLLAIAGLIVRQNLRTAESVRIFEATRLSTNRVSLGIDSCQNSAELVDIEFSGDSVTVTVEHPWQNDRLDCAEAIVIDVPEIVTVVIDGSTNEVILIEPIEG